MSKRVFTKEMYRINNRVYGRIIINTVDENMEGLVENSTTFTLYKN